jgi:quercetin dioxygenase-like cupin family protein
MKKVNVFQSKGAFFKVLAGTGNSQVAVMTIRPGGNSGSEESHPGDQVVLILEGTAEVRVGEETAEVVAGDVAIIPAGARHVIRNNSAADVFLLSFYAPPAY